MEENITKKFLRATWTDQNILVVDDELVNHILIFQVRSTDGEVRNWLLDISIVVKQMYVKVGIHCEMEDQIKLIISLGF